MVENQKRRRKKRRRKKKLKKLLRLVAMVAAVLLLIFIILVITAKKEISVVLNGKADVKVSYGQMYQEEGAKAAYQSTFLGMFREELPINIKGNVDNSKVGKYEIIYSATKGDITGKAVRKVEVVDDKAPELTLISSADSYTLPGHEYTEEGYMATDNYDGDITDKVIREEKNGTVYYTATDASGNTTKKERKIVYDDRQAPVIELSGDDLVIVNNEWNGSYNAIDDLDGDVTSQVVVSGNVDTSTPGDYVIDYYVSDSYGNEATATRTVTVVAKPNGGNASSVDVINGTKIVFLTFDDGPCEYTSRLLDILAKYGAKATFFVTNQFSGYQDYIAREYNEGHTVAVHTYSHRYEDIYSSDSAYWEDFNAMNDVIEAQTGSRSDVFRFPGGSSNTTSALYSDGIMTRLTDQAIAAGLDYYDWNVSSGDAGGTSDPSEIAANVINGMETYDVSVVLMHDIHSYSVDAVEEILSYGLRNGYSFLALQKGIYKCHHGVNN